MCEDPVGHALCYMEHREDLLEEDIDLQKAATIDALDEFFNGK